MNSIIMKLYNYNHNYIIDIPLREFTESKKQTRIFFLLLSKVDRVVERVWDWPVLQEKGRVEGPALYFIPMGRSLNLKCGLYLVPYVDCEKAGQTITAHSVGLLTPFPPPTHTLKKAGNASSTFIGIPSSFFYSILKI